MQDLGKYEDAVKQRLSVLLEAQHSMLCKRIDHLFLALLPVETVALVAAAIVFAPVRFANSLNILIYMGLAAAIAAVATVLTIIWSPGSAMSRHVTAISQVMLASVLIQITGGLAAAHFLVFVSLAVLAMYRERKVLLTASAVLAVDLIFRRIFFPDTALTLLGIGAWPWMEQIGWLVGIIALLLASCTLGEREIRELIAKQAEYEVTTAMLPTTAIKLKASEARFRSLASSSPIGIFQTDSQNRCVYTNERWVSLTGLSDALSQSAGWMQAIHQDDRANFAAAWSSTVAARQEFSSEFRLADSALEPRWGRCRATALTLDDGSLGGYVGTIEEITDTKRAEAEMQRAKETAEAASRSKSEFLANMSHEIRTPMTAILGHADILLRPELGSEERVNCVKTIRRNGQHLLNVINDILDISKIEAGRMTVERIHCSPVQIIAEVAALMRVRAVEKGLQFSIQYDTPMPTNILSDPTRLRQILMNLIGNAVKFTSHGEIRLVVAVDERADPTRTMLRFDVIDSGIGLTLEQRVKILLPFSQADTSHTRKYGGTGLGLAISTRLAEMLGGGISIQSESGKGSTFTIRIDSGSLANVPMIDNPEQFVDASVTGGGNTRNIRLRGRVLVAEDGPDNQLIIEFYLRELGLEVQMTPNGRIACEKALAALEAKNAFDVILMDMQMPDMDGYTAAKHLRANNYTAPIVALTAHAMQSDKAKCLDAGCSDYITKPIVWEELLRVLRAHMQEVDGGPVAPTPLLAGPLLSDLPQNPRTAGLIAAFISRLPQRIADIELALSAQDDKKLKTLTHQLKGAAAGYGFPKISDAARSLEELMRAEEDIAKIKAQASDLIQLCQRASVTPGAAVTATR